VVGISSPLRLYEITGFRDRASAAEIERLGAWEKAVELFEKRQFAEAERVFSSLSAGNADDGMARTYLDRCRDFIASPPPDNWDGVNNLSRK
jgi:adenylate cyclase